MTYEQALLAAGIPPEQAQRDAYANELVFWQNREHPNYGQREESDDDR